MAKCDFCQTAIEIGTGKLYVKKDGKQFHFCSSKCEKNAIVLKRKSRFTKWTGEFQRIKQGGKS